MNTRLDNIFPLAFFVLAGIAMITGVIWALATEKRLKKFFLGKKAKDLEDTIMIMERNITELARARESMERNIVLIQAKLKKSLRSLETIRFNPFSDQGSNQSF